MARVALQEDFADLIIELADLAAEQGYQIVPTAGGGFRSRAQQVALKRRKPTLAAAPGRSYHESGLALDFDTRPLGGRVVVGRLAESLGLRWGGRWRIREPWHVDAGSLISLAEGRALLSETGLVEVE